MPGARRRPPARHASSPVRAVDPHRSGDGEGPPGPPSAAAEVVEDAYRRQKTALDGELTRLGLRKNHLELAMGDPAVAANFVELRRVTSELADVTDALAVAEDAWLELEERAP